MGIGRGGAGPGPWGRWHIRTDAAAEPARAKRAQRSGDAECALGDGATSPITSGIKYFRQEFLDLCSAQPSVARPDQLAELTGASA